jgi:hypothetical protein
MTSAGVGAVSGDAPWVGGAGPSTNVAQYPPAQQPQADAQSAGFIPNNNTNSALTQQKSGMGAIEGTVSADAQWVGGVSTLGNMAQHLPQPQHSAAPTPRLPRFQRLFLTSEVGSSCQE